jgi:hypothetical protein
MRYRREGNFLPFTSPPPQSALPQWFYLYIYTSAYLGDRIPATISGRFSLKPLALHQGNLKVINCPNFIIFVAILIESIGNKLPDCDQLS